MKLLFVTIFSMVTLQGCAQSTKAVAMDEYNPDTVTSSEVVVLTKKMIKEAKKRREKFLKEHPNIHLP